MVTAHGELDHESGAKWAISADAVDLELIPEPGWATSGAAKPAERTVRGVQQPLQDLIKVSVARPRPAWQIISLN
jgi:hypothetical protein